jgi:glycosyltransferase involved in cell wall biosynthesis
LKKKIYIITNESFYFENNTYFCDNIDLKSIPEELSKNAEICIIGRKSKLPRTKKITLKEIKTYSNIISYLFSVLLTCVKQKGNYLIISISPFTFCASIILKLFFKKHFIYLRSDGYEEYNSILGFIGKFIYHLMFTMASLNSTLISCRKHILRGKEGEIVHPSQLNENWFLPPRDIDFKKIKLLYVGRIRIEKGVYSLLDIINKSDLELTIVTSEKDKSLDKIPKNVTVINFENYNDSITKFYDEHNILILPSYTEAHPQVLDEALARKRPVIIFKEIAHVVRDRKGVFVSSRDFKSLETTIEYIRNNYEIIKEEMMKNKLPTKKNFILELVNIII